MKEVWSHDSRTEESKAPWGSVDAAVQEPTEPCKCVKVLGRACRTKKLKGSSWKEFWTLGKMGNYHKLAFMKQLQYALTATTAVRSLIRGVPRDGFTSFTSTQI